MRQSFQHFLDTHRRVPLGTPPAPAGSAEVIRYEPIGDGAPTRRDTVSWRTVLAAALVSACVSAATTTALLLVVVYPG